MCAVCESEEDRLHLAACVVSDLFVTCSVSFCAKQVDEAGNTHGCVSANVL